VKRATSVLLFAAVLGAGACAQVLGLRPSSQRRPFEHRAHVLEGIHCNRCHEGVEDAGEAGPLHLPDSASCKSCHQKPHDERECGSCHGIGHIREGAALAREHLRFEHSAHMNRVAGDCVRCHLDIGSGDGVLRPRMANCLGCHEHRAEFAARNCDVCHVDLRNEGTRPDDHLVHEPDFLRGHGTRAAGAKDLCASCHAERFCTGCHAGNAMPTTPERLAFDRVNTAGVHRAGFMSRHAEEARGAPGLCTTCHAPSSCSNCHARKGVGGERNVIGRMVSKSPHPAGWVGPRGQGNDHGRAAWRDPALCASCHGGAGEMLCVGCHKVGGPGGSPHAPGFNSRMRKTIDRPCVLCHTGGR
jgi:hypothetical protein